MLKDCRLVSRRARRDLWRGRWLVLGALALTLIVAYFVLYPRDSAMAEHWRYQRLDIMTSSSQTSEQEAISRIIINRFADFDEAKAYTQEHAIHQRLFFANHDGKIAVLWPEEFDSLVEAKAGLADLPASIQPAATAETFSLREDSKYTLAKRLGKWGDFAQFNLIGFLVLWWYGQFAKNRWFQRLALATFLGAVFAGLSVNALRFTTGRPRPHATERAPALEDKFHWLTPWWEPGVIEPSPEGNMAWDYHGFPSGHTSTAMGMGTPVMTAGGIYGAPVFVFGASVGWSRLYQGKHYPSDVLVGGMVGIIWGIGCSWHLHEVRMRQRKRRRQLAT